MKIDWFWWSFCWSLHTYIHTHSYTSPGNMSIYDVVRKKTPNGTHQIIDNVIDGFQSFWMFILDSFRSILHFTRTQSLTWRVRQAGDVVFVWHRGRWQTGRVLHLLSRIRLPSTMCARRVYSCMQSYERFVSVFVWNIMIREMSRRQDYNSLIFMQKIIKWSWPHT